MTENQLKYLAYQESLRHNAATEADATRKTDETIRSNRMNESLRGTELSEVQRSNLARETETNRSNLARESETNRSNLVNEAENERSNRAREYENSRHNAKTEELTESKLMADAILGAANTATKLVDAFVPG